MANKVTIDGKDARAQNPGAVDALAGHLGVDEDTLKEFGRKVGLSIDAEYELALKTSGGLADVAQAVAERAATADPSAVTTARDHAGGNIPVQREAGENIVVDLGETHVNTAGDQKKAQGPGPDTAAVEKAQKEQAQASEQAQAKANARVSNKPGTAG